MDAVTYPEKKVYSFIGKNIIPVRVPFDSKPEATDFNVKWTPTLITLDTEGKEHHRTLGFLSVSELIPSLMLGMAKVDFDTDRFEGALEKLDKVLSEYPRSDSTPEAIYLQGVSGYKSSGDPKPLKKAWEKLEAQYPASEWAKRAYPYRLL